MEEWVLFVREGEDQIEGFNLNWQDFIESTVGIEVLHKSGNVMVVSASQKVVAEVCSRIPYLQVERRVRYHTC